MITKENVRFFYKWSGKDTLVHVVAEYLDGTCELFAESDSIKNYTTKFDHDKHNELCEQAFNRLLLKSKEINLCVYPY